MTTLLDNYPCLVGQCDHNNERECIEWLKGVIIMLHGEIDQRSGPLLWTWKLPDSLVIATGVSVEAAREHAASCLDSLLDHLEVDRRDGDGRDRRDGRGRIMSGFKAAVSQAPSAEYHALIVPDERE
jgi:hypothetical protein